MSLARRVLRPELMDDPTIDPAAHRRALAGLARINRVSGSAGVLWPELVACGQPLSVLDIATGSGDVPIALARKAARAGATMTFSGCDISPTAVAVARGRGEPSVNFFPHDVLRDPLPDGFDVVMCSLFLHHLEDADAVKLLREMGRAARKMVLVNDLSRGRFNLGLVWVASHGLSRSAVVHADGPMSVRAAFTIPEAAELATAAGLTGATVRSQFLCRFLLSWRKPA